MAQLSKSHQKTGLFKTPTFDPLRAATAGGFDEPLHGANGPSVYGVGILII